MTKSFHWTSTRGLRVGSSRNVQSSPSKQQTGKLRKVSKDTIVMAYPAAGFFQKSLGTLKSQQSGSALHRLFGLANARRWQQYHMQCPSSLNNDRQTILYEECTLGWAVFVRALHPIVRSPRAQTPRLHEGTSHTSTDSRSVRRPSSNSSMSNCARAEMVSIIRRLQQWHVSQILGRFPIPFRAWRFVST